MAINQANILIDLEKLVNPVDKKEFAYGFLTAYGYSKATITRLRSSDGRNLAENPESGEIAFKKGVYFKPVEPGHNIHEIVDHLRVSTDVTRNNIRFVIATDWIDFVAYDLKADERLECLLTTLPENYTFFLPLAGFEKATIYSENPADVKAAEQMGRLFDLIKEKNQPKSPEEVHALNVFLTRLLFCFFAEDTGIFEKSQMSNSVASFTSEDGSDVATFFKELFEILNENDSSPIRKSKPAYLKNFPYVNGGLFKSHVAVPEFGAKARRVLLDCSTLKWSEINPDIFGSMFQSVIDEDQRGSLGQHYTSVGNIMKVIQPLFLDKLESALEDSRKSEAKLKSLLDRVSKIKIFDPACGSGNFLIIAYKELRKIEMAVFKALNEVSEQDVMFMSNIKLSQFYGIEIDDFAHEIALLSLWLTEHQMNQAFKGEFGYSPPSLPLSSSGNITQGNSLQLDWDDVCPKSVKDEVYICGNPPFLGSVNRSAEQNADMDAVFTGFSKHRYLDLVTCWFWKGANYIKGTTSELALVSTNSICQGVQVEMLWPSILDLDVTIKYAYQSFPWKNSARDNAAVHVVVVGLTAQNSQKKRLFKLLDGEWHEHSTSNISPYLIDGPNIVIKPLSNSLFDIPKMIKGNMPIDGGNLILTKNEKLELVKQEPKAAKWIKKLIGAEEFLQGRERFCLWLANATNDEINELPLIKDRVEKVRQMRLKSSDLGTRKLASRPHVFREVNNFSSFILVPSTTSERRTYVPVGIFDSKSIPTNANLIIPNGSLYEAGILMSTMHMDWLRTVGGRLESRYRYSATLIYNTYPWPKVSEQQTEEIKMLTEKILLIREEFPNKSLADLYDPNLMPSSLLGAHKELDSAVEKLYRDKPFKDSSERLEHLFKLYEKLNPESQLGSANGELW